MNTGQGISALDPTVGLLRKELDANNVPLGQEAQYFQAKGRPLSPQLVFLIQANQQLQQKMQNMQARSPQSTVADDLSAALVQQGNAQASSMMPARQQGIARLPVGDLGVRGMAGGGIVAFAEGGRSDTEDYVDPAESPVGKLLRALGYFGTRTLPGIAHNIVAGAENVPYYLAGGRKVANYMHPFAEAEGPSESADSGPLVIPGKAMTPPAGAVGGPRAAAPTGGIKDLVAPRRPAAPAMPDMQAAQPAPAPQEDPYMAFLRKRAELTPEQALAEAQDINKASGVTAAEAAKLKSLEARRAELEAEKTKSAEERKRDLMMQLAASAFGSVGKSRTLAQGLGSIGAGFAQGAMDVEKTYRGREKERKQMFNALEDAKNSMAEAQALRAAGDMRGARDKVEAAQGAMYQARLQERKIKIDERANDLREMGLRNEHAYQMAQIELGHAGLYTKESIAALADMTRAQGRQMSPEKVGDKLRELEASDEIATFTKQQQANLGENVVNTPAFMEAKDRKVLALFHRYYGGGMGSVDPGMSDTEATAFNKYKK